MIAILKKRWYVVFIIFILIGGYFYYNGTQQQKKLLAEKKITVSRSNIRKTLSLSGEVNASEKANLRFQSAGKLTWIGVKEGDVVKKYQGIASLDQRDIQKRMQKYLNSYVKTRLGFDQQKDESDNVDLWKLTKVQQEKVSRLVGQSQVDLNNSVLDVEIQSIAMQDGYLSSPIDGVVTHIDIPVVGVNIMPSTASFDIVNPQTLYFSVLADQTEVVTIRIRDNATIAFDSYPNNKVQGIVNSISYTPKTGETGTVYEVKLGLDNAQTQHIRLGMTGDSEFILDEKKNVITIPESYIQLDGDKQYVFVKNVDDVKEKRYIKTGLSDDISIEVTNGLQDGEVIYDASSV
ncbi:MAG: efflux RND transporter periplasmic adaptor subunit [Candidatus Roizmanbacteria bacterium]